MKDTTEPRKALTGLVTHIEVDVSRFELDAIEGGNDRMRRRLAERVLASIYGQADDEMLIAEPGDLIEYHKSAVVWTPDSGHRFVGDEIRAGLFVGHDNEGRIVVSDEDGNVHHVPPYRVHGVV